MSDGPVLPSLQKTEKSQIPVQNVKRPAIYRNSITGKTLSSEPEKLTDEFRSVGEDAVKSGH